MTPETMRIHKLLSDILTSAKRIQNRLQGESEESFTSEANSDLQDIVARRLTIIGEAAAALLRKHPAFCEEHPEIPLIQARGMRNTIVHDYDGILWDLVWSVAVNRIPGLIESIELFLQADSQLPRK